MGTEDLKEEIVNEEAVTPETGDVDEPTYTDDELQAIEHGWAPKDQWKGDESDWVSAKEFNRRGELFGKIKNLERDRESLRQASAHMKDMLAKAKETEYKRALATLKAEKKAAAEEGETHRMLEIDDQIEELTVDHTNFQQEASRIPEPQPINEAFIEWQQSNPWYTSDSDMRIFADSVGQSYAQTNPSATPEQIFKAVDKQIRKAYPEKFSNPRRSSPSKVEATPSGSNTGAKSKSKHSIKDLNDVQRNIMNTMVRTGVMSQEEYINELARIGEI